MQATTGIPELGKEHPLELENVRSSGCYGWVYRPLAAAMGAAVGEAAVVLALAAGESTVSMTWM